jgi:2-methylcitrate dehydratase
VSTQEDPEWTRRYHKDGDGQSYGGRVVVTLRNGEQVVDQIDVADAHPRGARPFGRDQYVEKFRVLAEPTLGLDECDRFLDLAVRLPELKPDEVRSLTMMATSLTSSDQPGIF